jgi:recombination protein RecA
MAAAKKVVDTSKMSRDDMVKVIRSQSKTPIIMGAKEVTEVCSIGRIRSGIATLDYLGGGGITEGRITCFAGKESSCKTTIALQVMARIIDGIKAKGEMKWVLWFDVEGAYDAEYAAALGIDNDYVIIKRTKVLEEAFKEADDLITLGCIAALVIDSVDGMVAAKTDGNAYEPTMGGISGAMSQHLPMLYSKILEFRVTSIFIKQARIKMGVMGQGEVFTFSGGRAFRHFCDSIFMFRALSNHNLTYRPIQVKAEKTRSSRNGLQLDTTLGECGIDIVRDLFKMARLHGLITGSGWYYYGEVKEQGEERFVTMLRDNTALCDVLRQDLYDNVIANVKIIGESVTEGEVLGLDLDEGCTTE